MGKRKRKGVKAEVDVNVLLEQRKKLPVYKERARVEEAVLANRVIVLVGETGILSLN
jgi:HrpA-like RNA helicase